MRQSDLQRKLQSRIQKRGNLIADIETLKAEAKLQGFRVTRKTFSGQIKKLVEEQKLDRKLMEILLVRQRALRMFDCV